MKRRTLLGTIAAGAALLLPRTAKAVSIQATIRVIYVNSVSADWEAVTTGGILVAGSTPVGSGNLQIIHDAVTAIAAAGGPLLTRRQVALFGGQTRSDG